MGERRVARDSLRIERVTELTSEDWQLLLMADPNRALVERYVERGLCFRASTGANIAGFAVLIRHDASTVELMNIGVDTARHGQGIGTGLLRHVMNSARDAGFLTMTVGTGNWPVDNLAFYQKAGFRIARIDPDYFTRNYPEPIIEDGICCRDRIDLTCDLTENQK